MSETTAPAVAARPAAVEPAGATGAELAACLCKCGRTTRSTFAPGHDARLAGEVGRAMVGLPEAERVALLAKLPSAALQAKARGVWHKAEAKIEARLEREAAKAEARATKAAEAAATPQPEWVTVEGGVKVGRWSYPARSNGAITERNTKRDGSGEWVTVEA